MAEQSNVTRINQASHGNRYLPHGVTLADAFVGYGFTLLNNHLTPEQRESMTYDMLHLWRAEQGELQRQEQARAQQRMQRSTQQANPRVRRSTQATTQGNAAGVRRQQTSDRQQSQRLDGDMKTEKDIKEEKK